MRLHIADMPENAEDVRAWLERKLASLSLRELAAELAAIHAPSPKAPALEDALVGEVDRVLEEGLRALAEQDVRLLLRCPALRLQLQE